ncbi:MAG: YggS family pyridoxal phosphate-dependent enzyme [Ginsengibacter sp.]
MGININIFHEIKKELDATKTTLVAVSKIQSEESILKLYDAGQRDFGENYVQELLTKYEHLPKDINWHYIGHLQSNKVKYIVPFVSLIQGVDSEKLLTEINKQSLKNDRITDCLLQVHIAEEETKFGFDKNELEHFFSNENNLKNVRIRGLMGMASFTDDKTKVKSEFLQLKNSFDEYFNGNISVEPKPILSMGMSGDYKMAIEEGSNMVRIGSLLFGARIS